MKMKRRGRGRQRVTGAAIKENNTNTLKQE